MKKQRDYPMAVTRCSSQDDRAVPQAIVWSLQQLRATGGVLLLYLPAKSNVRVNQDIAGLSKMPGVVTATWRAPGVPWRGGPVLAAWPRSDKLGEVMDRRGVTALCVVPWLPHDMAVWAAACKPARVRSTADEGLQVGIPALDPVVQRGLEMLDRHVDHAYNLTRPLDRRDAVAVLRTLNKGGHELNADAIHTWALAKNWQSKGAVRLRQLAADIAGGKPPQMNGLYPFESDILDVWRRQARRSLR